MAKVGYSQRHILSLALSLLLTPSLTITQRCHVLSNTTGWADAVSLFSCPNVLWEQFLAVADLATTALATVGQPHKGRILNVSVAYLVSHQPAGAEATGSSPACC